MNCYFLRHGIAAEPHDWRRSDDVRPLTPDGITRMRAEAKAIAGLSLGVDRIVTSPLLRARQTADIVAEALQLNEVLVDDSRLAHGFNVKRLAAMLQDWQDSGSIMLVGHEPTMSETIGRIAGDAQIELKKGALAGVTIADRHAPRGPLIFLIPPKILLALGKG